MTDASIIALTNKLKAARKDTKDFFKMIEKSDVSSKVEATKDETPQENTIYRVVGEFIIHNDDGEQIGTREEDIGEFDLLEDAQFEFEECRNSLSFLAYDVIWLESFTREDEDDYDYETIECWDRPQSDLQIHKNKFAKCLDILNFYRHHSLPLPDTHHPDWTKLNHTLAYWEKHAQVQENYPAVSPDEVFTYRRIKDRCGIEVLNWRVLCFKAIRVSGNYNLRVIREAMKMNNIKGTSKVNGTNWVDFIHTLIKM